MSSDLYSLPSVIDLSDAETCAKLEERARFDTWVALEGSLEDFGIPDEFECYAGELADQFMRNQSVGIPREMFRDLPTAKRARLAIRDTYFRAAVIYLPVALRELRRQYRAVFSHGRRMRSR